MHHSVVPGGTAFPASFFVAHHDGVMYESGRRKIANVSVPFVISTNNGFARAISSCNVPYGDSHSDKCSGMRLRLSD